MAFLYVLIVINVQFWMVQDPFHDFNSFWTLQQDIETMWEIFSLALLEEENNFALATLT